MTNAERSALASLMGVLLGLWLTIDTSQAQLPILRVLLGCIAIGFFCSAGDKPQTVSAFAAAAAAAIFSLATVSFMAFAFDSGIRETTVQSAIFSGQKLSFRTPNIALFLGIFTMAVFLGVVLASYAKRPLVAAVSNVAQIDPSKVTVWVTAATGSIVAITVLLGKL